MKIIDYMVLFVVGFIWLNVVSLLRFPHLRVFVYALEPRTLYMRVWSQVRAIAIHVLGYILMFVLIMYVIWYITKKFIPNFPLPFKKIILSIPPLPQLDKSGIFRLINRIHMAVLGRGKISKRLKMVGVGIGEFIATGSVRLLQVLGISKLAHKSTYMSQPYEMMKGKEDLRRKNEARRKQKPFESAEDRTMDDEYQQCLEENTLQITEDMNKNERQIVSGRNSMTQVMCKVRKLQSYARTLSGKL